MLATARKRGNTIGLVIDAEVARKEGIRPGDVVEVAIRRRIPPLEELGGTVKLKHELVDLRRELKRGWDDL